jgi:hypothetical protein
MLTHPNGFVGSPPRPAPGVAASHQRERERLRRELLRRLVERELRRRSERGAFR